ncbi:hypothetical protein [Frigoriglobus tundricola]|uniref:Uncharacterized protein n=1 Tax=Frigoriglobus tundricola TaxID=2774151 RepID=A0A6M5YZE0_9BACT|nr:hypothetical protein [Frigoriglobus tundricola]QJW98593.1 hypothetical protein FTUN_6188 [Frigoriglobus tundricola]
MELALGDDATRRVSLFLRQRVVDTLPLMMSTEQFIRAGYGDEETIAVGLGHHPEVISRVWDKLGEGLPDSACVLVSVTPALVDPGSARLAAFVSGTMYMVRVPESQWAAALDAGYRREFTGCWPSEEASPPDFGPEWFEGQFQPVEQSWVRAFIAPW